MSAARSRNANHTSLSMSDECTLSSFINCSYTPRIFWLLISGTLQVFSKYERTVKEQGGQGLITPSHCALTMRERVPRPGRRMLRVCTGTQVHYEQAVRERMDGVILHRHTMS